MVRVFSQKDKNTGVSIKNYSSTRKYVSTRECLMDHFIYQKWVIDLGNVVVIDWTRAANHLFPSSEETVCTNRAKLKNLPVRSCARPLTKFQEDPTIEFFARGANVTMRRARRRHVSILILLPWIRYRYCTVLTYKIEFTVSSVQYHTSSALVRLGPTKALPGTVLILRRTCYSCRSTSSSQANIPKDSSIPF